MIKLLTSEKQNNGKTLFPAAFIVTAICFINKIVPIMADKDFIDAMKW